MTTIYIVSWRHGDRNGYVMVKAFSDEKMAQELLDILKTHAGDKEWTLTPLLFEHRYES